MNNKIIIGIVGAIVLVGASFYGGMAYGKSSVPSRGGGGNEQFMGMGNGQFQGGGGMRGGMSGGLTAGEIIAKDDSSITVKMQDGSTKIVLTGDSTTVMKTTEGSLSDLSVGTSVTVTGTTNSDGSMTGQSIQIRPEGGASFGGPMRTSQ